jgi:integrase
MTPRDNLKVLPIWNNTCPIELARGPHPTYVQKSLGHASVQLTLDRYSHWMPSMGRNTADGIDEALG